MTHMTRVWVRYSKEDQQLRGCLNYAQWFTNDRRIYVTTASWPFHKDYQIAFHSVCNDVRDINIEKRIHKSMPAEMQRFIDCVRLNNNPRNDEKAWGVIYVTFSTQAMPMTMMLHNLQTNPDATFIPIP